MGGEWREGPLGEVIELKRGYDLPQKDRIRGSVPIVSSSGISDYHIESKVTGPGVVTGRYGTIGQVFFIDCDFWPLNTTLYVRDFKGNDPLFISYFLRTLDFQAYSDKAAVPGVNRNHLHQARVRFPLLPEQKAIARILSSLDDKIELNRCMNATLEQMAQALFRAWFVDFEPVRAKAAGLQPTSADAQTAGLFPSELVESELGLIPKGWEVVRLGEIADLNWGDTNVTKKQYVSSGYLAYSASGPDGDLPYYDFDFSGVVVSAIGASAGTTWLATGKWSCIKNTLRFWSASNEISTEYLYQATLGKEKWPLRGSAQPFISQGDARMMRILYPSNNIAKLYGEIIRPYHNLIVHNKNQSQTLVQLRDTLLPRLISGRLGVPKAEKIVSET